MKLRFLHEIFEDTDGGFSSKRVALFIFIILFVTIVIYVAHFGVAIGAGKAVVYAIPKETLDFLASALEKIKDIIVWLGAFVLADKTPAALAALKGTPSTEHTVTTSEKTTGG